jgi:hypothetical protein
LLHGKPCTLRTFVSVHCPSPRAAAWTSGRWAPPAE